MSHRSALARLGLGTVQFGLDYGVTNRDGRVSSDEASAILDAAAGDGVDLLDTAALYGESEAVLGASLAGRPGRFKIVTKTDKRLNAPSAQDAADGVRRSLHGSLERLRTPSVHALLVHDARELLDPFGDARWRALSDLRAQGAADRIGASVYEGAQIDALLDRYDIDLIQAPLNAVDARLSAGGQLDRLADRGVALHVRSLFLQGLLLLEPEQLEPRFTGLRPHLLALKHAASDHGVPVKALLFHAVLSLPVVERAVVGVASLAQWRELASDLAPQLAKLDGVVYTPPPIPDQRLLNPAQWASLPGP